MTAPRVVILGRVSTADKTQDPQVQVNALQAVGARLGWQVVEVITAKQSAWDAKSAKEVQDKALQPIKEGRADTLAVWALDRVARGSTLDTLSFIQRLEDHYGAQFYSLQEPFLSTAGDKRTRELLMPILAWVAKQESDRKSERMKAKANFKRQAATNGGGNATWGRGKLPSPSDVAAMRAMRARQPPASFRAIAKELGFGLATVHRALQGSVPEAAAEHVGVPRVAGDPEAGGGPERRSGTGAQEQVVA